VSDPAPPTYAVVTGGGTAGHVLPALAIAEAMVVAGHPRSAIHYAGAQRGIEARLLPPTGHPFTLLPGRGIQRRLTLANVAAVASLLRAGVQAVRLVRRLRPSVVVAVGGYASVAVGLAAVLCRVPLLVAEQNQSPGAANRLLARFAVASAVSFPGTALPRAVVTGNPIRPEILTRAERRDQDQAEAKASLGVDPHRRLLLVFGGSLGARRINDAVLGALPGWRSRPDLAVHHVVGRRDWGDISAQAPSDLGELAYRAVEYEDEMPTALAAADLAVCRSGSSTCFELAAMGLPSVLVPSPHVTADQQTGNARHLVDAGAAELLADAELSGPTLAEAVDRLLDDDGALRAMGAAARRWARPDAAAEIAALAEAHARG
jgi:UDP-N-acetylglucosamine--N-acetylmuramyl-(pentapeptide) pyrophosphoryl-undecaprenol N-acetylglucosamine transferase